MSFTRWRALAAALLVALPQLAGAEVPVDPYVVQVPVPSQSTADLQRAQAIALREIAVRISGRGDADSHPAITGATGIERYVEQYRFERNPASSDDAAPWLVHLRFSPAAVEQLLRTAGLVSATATETLELRVAAIAGFDDYAALLQYLQRLTLLKAVQPAAIAGDEVALQLQVQGGAEALARQFALDGRLVPQGAEAGAPLRYRWASPRS